MKFTDDYKITELPKWEPYNEHADYALPRWSGAGPLETPPAIGQRVDLKLNSLSPGTVVGYFIEYDFLGVQVKLDKEIPWNGEKVALVFGSEIEEEKC